MFANFASDCHFTILVCGRSTEFRLVGSHAVGYALVEISFPNLLLDSTSAQSLAHLVAHAGEGDLDVLPVQSLNEV
jgi:hypothetical protein